MTYVLNARERAALNQLSLKRDAFLARGQLEIGRGNEALEALEKLGLAETGSATRFADRIGWRITEDGWRCMYGKTYAEIMAPGAPPSRPLEVWSWPPAKM